MPRVWGGRRRSRAILVGCGLAVVAGIAIVGARAVTSNLAAPNFCATTKTVVARAVPVLDKRFVVASLTYECRGPIAGVEYDSAQLGLTSGRSDWSRTSLLAAVRADLRRAGWASRQGRRDLVRRENTTSYTASVTVSSSAPALVIVDLVNRRPASGVSLRKVSGERPEKRMSDAQRLRFVTVDAFVPGAVPRGYSAWGPPSAVDFQDVETNLTGGDGRVKPSLRSTAMPADYTTRECDLFAARTRGDRCVRWAQTPSGTAIYIARDDSTADGLASNPSAVVSGTLVTLLYAHNHRYVRPALSRTDVVEIFDSLRSRNSPARR